MLVEIQTVQPASAESECTKVIINKLEQLFSFRMFNGCLFFLEIPHVVATVAFFPDIAFTGGTEGLYSIDFPFFHFFSWIIGYNRNGFTPVNFVTLNIMAI